jgi:uncharacterized membrane protein
LKPWLKADFDEQLQELFGMTTKAALSALIALITLLYPLAVYFGIRYFQPWQIAGSLIALLAIRLLAVRSAVNIGKYLVAVGIAYCGFAFWRNDLTGLRLYPVIINSAMLLLFSWSLHAPPTVIERLARLQHPDLPPEGIVYTRRVTQVWCLFFFINGGLALVTALWCSFEVWSLYNGLIAYLLMGILFAGEYIVRIRTQKHVR